MNAYLTLDDVDVAGKRVLVRSDLNVPLDDGSVGDDFRLRSALPTLERLVEAGGAVTVCSHLGRPEGPDPAFSLEPVAARMTSPPTSARSRDCATSGRPQSLRTGTRTGSTSSDRERFRPVRRAREREWCPTFSEQQRCFGIAATPLA